MKICLKLALLTAAVMALGLESFAASESQKSGSTLTSLAELDALSRGTFKIETTFLSHGSQIEFTGQLPKKCFENLGIIESQKNEMIEVAISLPQACRWNQLSRKERETLQKSKFAPIAKSFPKIAHNDSRPQIYFLENTLDNKSNMILITRTPIGVMVDKPVLDGNWINSPVTMTTTEQDIDMFAGLKAPRKPEAGDDIPEDWNPETDFRVNPRRYSVYKFTRKNDSPVQVDLGAGYITQSMTAAFIRSSVPLSKQNRIGVGYDFCQINSEKRDKYGNNNDGGMDCIKEFGIISFISHQIDDRSKVTLEHSYGYQDSDSSFSEIGNKIMVRVVKKI